MSPDYRKLYHLLYLAKLERYISRYAGLTTPYSRFVIKLNYNGKVKYEKTVCMPTFLTAAAAALIESQKIRYWEKVDIPPYDITVDGISLCGHMPYQVLRDAGVDPYHAFIRKLRPCEVTLELESGIPSTSVTSVP